MSDLERDNYGGRTPARGPPTVQVPSAMRSSSSKHKANADMERLDELPSATRPPSRVDARFMEPSARESTAWDRSADANRPFDKMDASATSNANRPSSRMDAFDAETFDGPRRGGDEETAVDLLNMMQVRGMDAGKKLPVLADNGENAHNVAAHIRMHFGQNEDVEFVSHQGRNFAALAYALYLQREQQDNQTFGLQQFDAFFGGGEATQAG